MKNTNSKVNRKFYKLQNKHIISYENILELTLKFAFVM